MKKMISMLPLRRRPTNLFMPQSAMRWLRLENSLWPAARMIIMPL